MPAKPFRVLLLAAAFVLSACASVPSAAHPSDRSSASSEPPGSPTALQTAGGSQRCHERGSGLYVEPDPACTPGATNPGVTPATVNQTICRKGWTSTVRPSASYTDRLERQGIIDYNLRDSSGQLMSTKETEEDHLIPLELGGSPTDPKNLWPEYDNGHIPNPKDDVENAAKETACAHPDRLPELQQKMATDWIRLGKELGVA